MNAWSISVLALLALGLGSCHSGRESLKSLSSGVQVERGNFNEPSILVTQAPDGDADQLLIKAQGHEEAKDSFFQMDISRRSGTGRMAELFGPKAEVRDRRVLGIGFREAVKKKTERLEREFHEEYVLLQKFSEGVNEYIAHMSETEAGRKLRDYYRHTLTGDPDYVPTPWEPADTVAIAQNMAFFLSNSLQEKLQLGKLGFAYTETPSVRVRAAARALRARGGDEAFVEELKTLLDLRPLYPTYILDADPAQNPWKKTGRPAVPVPVRVAAAEPMPKLQLAVPCLKLDPPFSECVRKTPYGSNNWAVSPDFSGTGEAFVANDVHPLMTYPGQFSPIALDSKSAALHPGTLRVRGYQLPGIAGVLIGLTDFFAWGLTNLGADVDDVYFERLDATGTKVKTRIAGVEQWVPIVESWQPIRVRLREQRGRLETKMVKVRWVPHHGPIFTDAFPELNEALTAVGNFYGGNFVGTYRWTGHEATAEFVAMIGVNRARNFSEFKTALGHFGTGAQNMVYADKDGNIGYYGHGNFPVRKYAANWVPYYPTLGTGAYEWEPDFRAHVPELYNPASGRIVTANNDPYGHSDRPALSNYEDYFGFGFSTGTRAHRIETLLDASRGNVTEEVMKRIQFDHVDGTLLILIQRLKDWERQLGLAPGSPQEDLVHQLTGFSGDMSRYERLPLVADVWANKLLDTFVEKTMSAKMAEAAEPIKKSAILVKMLHNWLADSLTAGRLSVDFHRALGILRESVNRAVAEYASQNLADVTWGKVHKLKFFNALEGLLPSPMTVLLERDGSFESIDVSGDAIGPSFRLISSLKPGRPIRAITSMAGGNHPTSDRTAIDEELHRWSNGEYRELVRFIRTEEP